MGGCTLTLAHPFEPIVGDRPKVLILGTFPSAASVEAGGYYGHPRNQFWRVMSDVLGDPIMIFTPRDMTNPLNWQKFRYGTLKRHGVALWDVVSACERRGKSEDSTIYDIIPNPVAELLHDHPEISTVVLNGTVAAKLYRNFITPPYPLPSVSVCPSTSPRNTLPYVRKLARWRRAIRGGLR